jgi:hypothetical protein
MPNNTGNSCTFEELKKVDDSWYLKNVDDVSFASLIGWFWFVNYRVFRLVNGGFVVSFTMVCIMMWFMVCIMMFVRRPVVIVIVHFSMTIIRITPLEQMQFTIFFMDFICRVDVKAYYSLTVGMIYRLPAGLYTGFGAGYFGSSWYLGAWL